MLFIKIKKNIKDLEVVKKVSILIMFILLAASTFAQNSEHDSHHETEHEHKLHEIGISFAPVYFFGEKELNLATHLHYVYNFHDTKVGIGIGYERIFDEHKHNFIGIEFNYRPIHALTFNISPGISFESEEKDKKELAVHFETVYEFEVGTFHIGPLLELAYHPENFHCSIGIHLGLGL